MCWYRDVHGDGSILCSTEELVLKESGDVIVDGDLYPHTNARCHRSVSQLSQSLTKRNAMSSSKPLNIKRVGKGRRYSLLVSGKRSPWECVQIGKRSSVS